MVVFISLGARDFSAKSLSIIMSFYLIFLTVNHYPRFHKLGGRWFLMFLFLFFFILSEEKTAESSGQTPDKFSVSYPEVLERSPKALRKQEGNCSRENSVW